MKALCFALHPLRRSQRLAASVLLALAASIDGAPAPVGTFPFKRDGQLMVVEARIEKAPPALFMLDSGASHTVFDPTFAKELGLETKEALPTTGTGSGAVAKSHTRAVAMTLHDVKLDLPEPWVIDLSNAPMPRTIRGLVGAELFKEFVVRMDPLQSKITVFDPASYHHEGDAASIPLTVDGDKLFLEATLEVPAGQFVTHKLRIDTGSESSVNDEVVKQSEEVRTSILGGGLGEQFKSYSGVFSSVKLGPYVIKHVWGPGGPGPSIGMELLRRFVVTFDAPHGRIYLERTPQLNDPVPTPPPN
ncbi:MAG: clan AA aspartic protease [Chthoniobacterales bacterium]|nr:clan AA aspartic protease [Chthoniobacterales bacterium]